MPPCKQNEQGKGNGDHKVEPDPRGDDLLAIGSLEIEKAGAKQSLEIALVRINSLSSDKERPAHCSERPRKEEQSYGRNNTHVGTIESSQQCHFLRVFRSLLRVLGNLPRSVPYLNV